ncbi:VOC family protein [Anaerosphaera multitolerans]|uniref:Glyoxalase n=1 Tax=Anaerosphaera multitolerans TaxID=2487351 RepID=A0A437S4C4_9FIRM|nr:VOC family protein [Anaerosphaera multitolerans]RVU53838.1 glyoxalase [Anaerosphaera multitolerans]
MSIDVLVNVPVKDIKKSIIFYECLGFKYVKEFSSEDTATMKWNDNFAITLLTHGFHKKLIRGKNTADAEKDIGVFVSFILESPEAVKKFAEVAKENGGDYYEVDLGISKEKLYFLEVEDLDGNILEPNWMVM